MKALTKKLIKRTMITVLVLGVLFVVGDYFGLFISFHADGTITIPYRFEFVNSANGNGVSDVEVTAEHQGNALYVRKEQNSGKDIYLVIRGCGGLKRILFDPFRSCARKYNKQEIDFTFKHPLYATAKKTISIDRDGTSFNIKLAPLNEKAN